MTCTLLPLIVITVKSSLETEAWRITCCPALAVPVSAVDGGGSRGSGLHGGGVFGGGGAVYGDGLPVSMQLAVFTVNSAERLDLMFGTAAV